MNDSQFHNGKRTRRGVSLIEVLVVLVILVVGILTIIRLFPSGFFSIQSTGNAGLADSLGNAAIDLGAQTASSLPEAILPGDNLLTLANSSVAAMYSNYDPEDPNTLNNARIVSNETITVPSVVNGRSVYVVHYGPVVMPADPASQVTQLLNYFTVNSPYWTPQTGDSTPEAVAGSTKPVTVPQDRLVPGQERFLVDLATRQLAVPYAFYTPTSDNVTFTLPNGQSARTAVSYSQKMVLTVSYFNSTSQTYGTFTRYLNVPPGTPRDSTNQFAPLDVASLTQSQAYLPDTYTASGNYQGDWFDPMAQYQDSSLGTAGTSPTSGTIQWLSATLYRPYTGVLTGHDYSDVVSVAGYDPAQNDPYQFKLLAANFGTANPGAIGFNPRAANGSGTQARKAKISYIVSSWQILREDHDIPALSGASSTFAVRTTVPNLKLAGSANPDNSINPGIAGSNYSLVVLDLDSGRIIAPSGVADPTNPDSPVNNEDLNGTKGDPSLIDISYALGRLTFGSDAFGDNSSPTPANAPGTDGKGTAPAHRIRIFYTADLDWTVAVQKPAAYFNQVSTLGTPLETTPLAANEFAYDPSVPCVYVARCNAGKTVEVDGTATPPSGGTASTFTQTTAVSQVLVSLNAPDVQILLPPSVAANSTITFSAVRGLSARSVVAWKERNRYKVHSVDTLLNRTP